MSRIFIELYLDEDVDVLIGELLRRRGFSVVTTRDSGRAGVATSDSDQLAFATQIGAAMLVHSRVHFEALAAQYVSRGQNHCGIIVAVRRPPHEIVRRLLPILNQVAADEMDNQLRYI